MKITHIEIYNFRNLQYVNLDPSPQINIFYGLNGSGKTSLLEAIYYLGLGRSFRTRNISRIINNSANSLSIFCQLFNINIGMLPVGIERNKESYAVKIGGKSVGSLYEIVQLLPLQLFNSDSHLLLNSGPSIRRQFLDWGVFHVEPQFYNYWQRASRIIRQRNAHLKIARNYHEIALWDNELQTLAICLDAQRQQYMEKFQPIFRVIIDQLLSTNELTLQYKAGWNTQGALGKQLRDSFDKDKYLGYTQYGPHRADICLKINNIQATDYMSQGQQKLAAYALKLAQGTLLQQQGNKECIFLIDDLPSELDKEKRDLVSELLINLRSQIFVTAIEPAAIAELQFSHETKTFHVEQGTIKMALV